MQKQRCYAEVLNDKDGEIVNVFRVLRDDAMKEQLKRLLIDTPFARDEFLSAYEVPDDPVEQARRTIIKSFMGFGSAAIHDRNASGGMRTRASTWKAPTGFRSNSSRSGTTPAHDWMHYPDHLDSFTERLRGVVIENSDALQVMGTHDGPETLIYLDPPYVLSTRDNGLDYRFEMTDEDHRELAKAAHEAKGMVIISGYRSELYDELYAGWTRAEFKALADGAKRRTEYLWLSPRVAEQVLRLPL